MNKIEICLWFDDQAEEAADFYTSLFPNSKILSTSKYTSETPSNKPIGSVMTVSFQIGGQNFMALNGGPFFKPNEAVSLVVNCETQEELDQLWEKLSADPKAEQCGWLKDKFGISWQIVPKALGELMASKNPEKSRKVMEAMLKMKKIVINELREVYNRS